MVRHEIRTLPVENPSKSSKMDDGTDLLRGSLVQFFKNPDHLQRVTDVINNKRKHPRAPPTNALSLRLVDFFVVNFARDNAVLIRLNDETVVDVYKSYQVTQERFRKKCFDPFARGGNVEEWRINGQSLKTNVRQLCFMRWAIENRVLDYIQEHHQEIEDAMNKDTVIKRSLPARRRGCRVQSSPDKYLVTRTRSKITVRLQFC